MLIGALAQYFFGFTIFVLSSFLVLLVLVQRGRGGGLTGALGGPGGQSAFGTKAGDLFTRITIGVATAWILLCATAVFMLRSRGLPDTGGSDRPTVSSNMGTGAGAGTTSGTTTGATETGSNSSALPQLDLSNLNQSKTELPELKTNAPGEGATAPAATESTTPASAESTTPVAPVATPPAAEPASPPAATGAETPPAPK